MLSCARLLLKAQGLCQQEGEVAAYRALLKDTGARQSWQRR